MRSPGMLNMSWGELPSTRLIFSSAVVKDNRVNDSEGFLPDPQFVPDDATRDSTAFPDS
jgi:hypothetical protein